MEKLKALTFAQIRHRQVGQCCLVGNQIRWPCSGGTGRAFCGGKSSLLVTYRALDPQNPPKVSSITTEFVLDPVLSGGRKA